MAVKLNQHILVIDDSPDNRDLLKMILDANGFTTDCAPNGEEALSLMKLNSDLPELILLDANMPVMDGFRFRTEQAKDERLKNIPVVVMSGDCDSNINERMNYPHSLLPKPFSLEAILEHVSGFFDQTITPRP
jgi:CheY-like chemotaxis protein